MIDFQSLVDKFPGRPGLLTSQFIAKFDYFPNPEAEDARHKRYNAAPLAHDDPKNLDFARAKVDAQKRRIPQAIAHRGYSSKYAENSLRAFDEAIKAGAHALETDMSLSKDGVVVLSHDPNLKRCFSVDRKINECDWEWLRGLRSTGKDSQALTSLGELLDLIVESRADDIWILLDIKMYDEPEALFKAMSSTLKSAKQSPGRPWKDRVLLGFWTSGYLDFCQRYFPDFATTNIGFHLSYCNRFAPVSNSGYVTFQSALLTPFGSRFISRNKRLRKPVIAWSVNDERSIQWCFERGLDGVLVSDMLQYEKVRKGFGHDIVPAWSWKALWTFLKLNFWIFSWGLIHSQRVRNQRREARRGGGG